MPSVIKWFAALLTEEMEKTSVIAKKPAAASVHLSRRIGVPSLSYNAGVISAPTVTAIHRSRLTPSRFAVCRPFPRIPKINVLDDITG